MIVNGRTTRAPTPLSSLKGGDTFRNTLEKAAELGLNTNHTYVVMRRDDADTKAFLESKGVSRKTHTAALSLRHGRPVVYPNSREVIPAPVEANFMA